EPREVLLAPGDGRTRAWLYRLGAVIGESIHEDGCVALTLRANAALLSRLEAEPAVLLQRAEPVHKLSTLGLTNSADSADVYS
ncbi:MAG: hypothetical protein ACC642_02330, partial [Pseudomonadales bacterium]